MEHTSRIDRPFRRGAAALVCAWIGLVAAGCAAKSVTRKEPGVFFPPAPGLPRIQYLTHFNGAKDVEEQSAFDRFIVGEKADLRLDKPYGIGIFDGRIYVCDSTKTVMVFDLKARTYQPLKGAAGPGRLVEPLNISIEADGTKYVTDPGRGQVVVFDRNDDYVKTYSVAGEWRPVDAVPFEDRLYVVDVTNRHVKVFDKASGEIVKTIGDKGEPSQKLDRPTNLAFDKNGDCYVTDAGRIQILRFDRDGHFKAAIGRPGDNLGHFARPKGLALDREGRLYVVDASFNNSQVFDPDGRLLLFFGGGGTAPGNFTLPAKVTLDYDNLEFFRQYLDADFVPDYLILVTSQFGERLVSVLAYGQERGRKYPSDDALLKEIEERRSKELEKLKVQEERKKPEEKPGEKPEDRKPEGQPAEQPPKP